MGVSVVSGAAKLLAWAGCAGVDVELLGLLPSADGYSANVAA